MRWALMMAEDNRLVAGIELGGTKSIAVIARGRDVIESARIPTGEPGATLAALGRRIEDWQAVHGRVAAIGIGAFGPIGLDRGRADFGSITSTPKPGWAGTDIVGPFSKQFGVPVGFDTDVAGAALAEHRWGAARGCDVAVYLTIGTGIGGGVVIRGAPVHGLVHPELGHIRVRRAPGDGFAGICPYHGDCLEGLASGPALAARAGLRGEEIGDDHPVWVAVIGEIAELIGMLMLTLSPERIIIGGGVFADRQPLLGSIRSRTAELLGGYVVGVGAPELSRIIVAPGLGTMAGPLGAVALAYRAAA